MNGYVFIGNLIMKKMYKYIMYLCSKTKNSSKANIICITSYVKSKYFYYVLYNYAFPLAIKMLFAELSNESNHFTTSFYWQALINSLLLVRKGTLNFRGLSSCSTSRRNYREIFVRHTMRLGLVVKARN